MLANVQIKLGLFEEVAKEAGMQCYYNSVLLTVSLRVR